MVQVAHPTEHADRLPRVEDVRGANVTFRLMHAGDITAVHGFFQEMARDHMDELLFLHRDMTQAREIETWALDIACGESLAVLAVVDGRVAGEASLRFNAVPWIRHVGTIRVMVAPTQRGRGLSRLLLRELFAVALREGIEHVMAEMMGEQKSAHGLFTSLGFVEEGHYRAFARDLEGELHDLVVMTADKSAMERLVNS